MTLIIPDIQLPRLSNHSLLEISATLFFLFVVAEIFGAILSNSLSLIGDASSMLVDVGTYICNMYAEWAKQRWGRVSNRTKLVLEVCIPATSVTALLVATGYIVVDAVMVLTNPPPEDDVNINYLYGYAAANLAVDIICTGLFYLRADDVFVEVSALPALSLDTSICFDSDEEIAHHDSDLDLTALEDAPIERTKDTGMGVGAPVSVTGINCMKRTQLLLQSFLGDSIASCCCCENCYFWGSKYKHTADDDSCDTDCRNSGNSNRGYNAAPTESEESQDHDDHHHHHHHHHGPKKNLNMMSAFTHVIGDMMRTFAMFAAALISSLTGMEGDKCDAWASLVVAGTIVLLCASLISEIATAALEIWYEEYGDGPPIDGLEGEAVFVNGSDSGVRSGSRRGNRSGNRSGSRSGRLLRSTAARYGTHISKQQQRTAVEDTGKNGSIGASPANSGADHAYLMVADEEI